MGWQPLNKHFILFGGRRGQMVSASARRPGGPQFESRPAVIYLQSQLRGTERKSIVLIQNGWMDARVCARVADRRDQLSGSDREGIN